MGAHTNLINITFIPFIIIYIYIYNTLIMIVLGSVKTHTPCVTPVLKQGLFAE